MTSFFDTPSVLLTNPTIPLHQFLPPLPSVDSESFKTLCIIATKSDAQNINSNVLFLRVSPITLRILTLALAAPFTEPERNWGSDVAASTLQYVLEEEKYGVRDKVVYQPAEWFNGTAAGTGAVFTQPCAKTQVLQLLKVRKNIEQMQTGGGGGEYEAYPSTEEVEAFWATVTEAKRVLNEAKDRGHTERDGEFQEEVRELKEAVEVRTWDVEGLKEVVEWLKGRLGIREVVGFESVY
jgi:hypothetical protein